MNTILSDEQFAVSFWTNVRDLLDRRGMSQEQTAEKIGVSAPSFRNALNSKRLTSVRSAYLIADALGVTIERIITGKDSPADTRLDSVLTSMQSVIDRYRA